MRVSRKLADGTTSRPRGSSPSKPTAKPDTAGLYARLRDTQAMFSFLRTTPREKLRPHVSVCGSNEIDLNGIANSAIQPPSKRPASAVEDAVPRAVEVGDVLVQAVGAHTVRIQAEEVAAAAGVERIERHVEAVVLADVVGLAQVVRRDLVGLGVVEPRADVQRLVVVEQIDLGALVGDRVLDRARLVQVVDERGRRPRGVVELAVDDGRASSCAPCAPNAGRDLGAVRAPGRARLRRRAAPTIPTP